MAWGTAPAQTAGPPGADTGGRPGPPDPTGETADAKAGAAEETSVGAAVQVEPLVVTGMRRPERIDAVPGSITVISQEELQAEVALSNNNLGDALGKLVPGLGIGSQSQSVFGQTLRGRKVLVLIDGIPQHTIRNVARDLQTISALAVERIEVIRGTTALYGEGAAGGIINIITRRPSKEGLELQTDVALTTAPRNATDALAGSFAQSLSHKRDRLDYTVLGTLERTGGLFDASGDRIPPDPHGQGGLADLWSWSGLGRFGVALGENQRLEVSASYFQNLQATDYTTDPSVTAAPPGSEKARALPGLDLEDTQGSRNALASLSYRHEEVLGGDFSAQVFFRDYRTRFFPFDGRAIASYGANVIQSRLESQRAGARIQANTPLPLRLSALYGIDASAERTAQPVSILDPQLFESSGGLTLRSVGDRVWVPRMEVANLAPFLQLQWDATGWLSVRGGVRQELIHLQVDDYTTLAGNAIQGGDLGFSKTLLSSGVVVKLPAGFSSFATVMQGYSLPDVGLVLRNAPPGSSLQTLNTEPQKVNAYELGLRRDSGRLTGSVAVFLSTSELGTSTGGFSMPVVRAPERVYGAEATLEARLWDSWRAGTAASWLEGKLDKVGDGNYVHLNTYRIPPLKLTGYLGKRLWQSWEAQLFAIYSGERDHFPESTMFGERPVEDFLLLELSVAGKVGPGRLRLGIANLLNRQYTPVTSQLLWSGTNTTHAAGTGIMATLGYSVVY